MSMELDNGEKSVVNFELSLPRYDQPVTGF